MSFSTMWNGASGIKSHMLALTSVADNVANISTHGYKGTRALFSDLVANKVALGAEVGAPAANQVGNGSNVGMFNNMSVGSTERTDNPFDLAIEGKGWFIMEHPDTEGQFYTRAGAFGVAYDSVEDAGYLANSEGYRVQGYMADANGNINVGALTDIEIPVTDDENVAAATTEVELGVNLDAEDDETHVQGVTIDPTDGSTYNYVSGVQVYDADGNTHDLYTYYSRIDNFVGPAPAGSANVWKAAMFEDQDGTMVANPAAPDNEFFIHFDNTGQIVGLSDVGGSALGFSYWSDASVVASTDAVSDRVSETFTFTGAGAQQVVRTAGTVTFGPAQTAGASVTIGNTYNIPDGLDAAQAGANLADQINGSGGNYYAVHDGTGAVTIYGDHGQAAAELTSAGTGVTSSDETSLDDLVGLINSGRSSSGAVYVDTAGMVDDAYLEVDGARFYYDDGVAPPPVGATTWTDLDSLAAAITANVAGVTATSDQANGGSSLYLAYDTAGLAGDAVTLASDLNGGGGSFGLSAATLQNGLDDTATHDVTAQAGVDTDSEYALQLTRSSDPNLTITIDTANTLGAAMTDMDFNDFSTVSNDPGGGAGATSRDFTFDFGAVGAQTITVDWGAEGVESTQSAGNNETFHKDQDGYDNGYLTNVEVDENGVITGLYSNGRVLNIAQVALAAFNSPESMNRVGDTLWESTEGSGDARIGVPGSDNGGLASLGTIESGALELSNVDLAYEVVNMINYQRAFQANSKSIQTGDEMLKTAINVKT